MNHRRHHPGLPSGRAEVELFRAWERELDDDVPDGAGVPAPLPEEEDALSTAPLWWALCLAVLFVLVALLA